jgi:hypothetical protein
MTISEQIDKLLEIQVQLTELGASDDIKSLDDGKYLIDETIRNCALLVSQLENVSTEDEDEQEDDERHEERERDLMAYYRER